MTKRTRAPRNIVVPIEFKSLDSDEGSFIGLASVYGNVDLHGDVVDRGAFTETIAGSNFVPILWQHDTWEPIGRGEVEDTFDGLLLHGQLVMSLPDSRGRIDLMKQQVLGGLSIGYDVIKSETGEDGIRHLTELRLWEVSLVTFPANTQATILQVKAVVPFQDLALAELNTAWDAEEASAQVKTWAKAEDGLNEEFLKAYLWHDEVQPEVFSSAQLPIAEVIDGRLTAVPEALFLAAKQVHEGIEGIGADDLNSVRSHLTRYYRKMRATFSDESILAPWEIVPKMKTLTQDFRRKLSQVCAELPLLRVDVKSAVMDETEDVIDSADLATLLMIRETIDGLLADLTPADGEEGEKDADLEEEEVVAAGLEEEKEEGEIVTPGADQGDDDKGYEYGGEPIELGPADIKSLADWSGSMVHVAEDDDEANAGLYADMKAFADTL